MSFAGVDVLAQPHYVTFTEYVSGLSSPVFATHAGDGTSRLFVLEQNAGTIRIVQQGGATGTLVGTPFLNISSKISSGGERGILGLAFHPNYTSNGRFFVHYTDTSGNTVISRFQRSGGDPNIADPTETIILQQTQPYSNHNGGWMGFGPDGYLYICLGDGGSANDPENRAQDVTTILGKVLRIDVDSGPTYVSPPTNPYYGAIPGRDEIFAIGFRNPWRASFERNGTRLFVGDVGQGAREEVDTVNLGENHGWKIMEGSICRPGGPSPCNQTGLTLPIHDYARVSPHCAVTGGYLYTGNAVPTLFNRYIFGDYCSGYIWAARRESSGEWTVQQIHDASHTISSFGEDKDGELYVCAHSTGRLYKVTYGGPPAAATDAKHFE